MRITSSLLLILVLAASALAGPIAGGTCTPGTAQEYVALGSAGCYTSGLKLFDWTFSESGDMWNSVDLSVVEAGIGVARVSLSGPWLFQPSSEMLIGVDVDGLFYLAGGNPGVTGIFVAQISADPVLISYTSALSGSAFSSVFFEISNLPPSGGGGTVPEPDTWLSVLAGGLLIGLGYRRKRIGGARHNTSTVRP